MITGLNVPVNVEHTGTNAGRIGPSTQFSFAYNAADEEMLYGYDGGVSIQPPANHLRG